MIHCNITMWNHIQFVTTAMHAYGHQWACQLAYNPHLCRGLGLMDGEGVERTWSQLRKLVGVVRTSSVRSFPSLQMFEFHRLSNLQRAWHIWLTDWQLSSIALDLRDDLGDWIRHRLKKGDNSNQKPPFRQKPRVSSTFGRNPPPSTDGLLCGNPASEMNPGCWERALQRQPRPRWNRSPTVECFRLIKCLEGLAVLVKVDKDYLHILGDLNNSRIWMSDLKLEGAALAVGRWTKTLKSIEAIRDPPTLNPKVGPYRIGWQVQWKGPSS